MSQLCAMAHAAVLAIFAFTGAQAQEQTSALGFINNTDATIRIEMVEGAGAATFVAQIVPPQQMQAIPVMPGPHIFDLVAFKAAPPHTHRIGIEFIAGDKTQYYLTPHRMGLYLLEDSDRLSALGTLPFAPPANELQTEKHTGMMLPPDNAACQPPDNDWESLVLWQSADQAQYYRRRGKILCGAGGEDLFHEDGLVYSHFICAADWTKCVRHPKGDFRALPDVRTSEIVDTAMKLAQADDPKAFYTRTWTIIAQSASRQTANMTAYLSFGSGRQKKPCPTGYRLHYQGFCINIADELADDPEVGVRTLQPEQ